MTFDVVLRNNHSDAFVAGLRHPLAQKSSGDKGDTEIAVITDSDNGDNGVVG